jgi:hypothetical protein
LEPSGFQDAAHDFTASAAANLTFLGCTHMKTAVTVGIINIYPRSKQGMNNMSAKKCIMSAAAVWALALGSMLQHTVTSKQIQSPHQPDTHYKTITGRVIDMEGLPVSKFNVYATRYDSERGSTGLDRRFGH